MKKLMNNQKGFVLPLVLVSLALMASGVSFFLAQETAELKADVMNRDYEFCILTAKNAMAVAQASLGEDLNYTGTENSVKDENGGTYFIKITGMSETLCFFDIESQYKTFTKQFTGELEIIPDSSGINKPEIRSVKWIMVELK